MSMASNDRPAIRVTLIAAVARNRVIGRGNRLPWRLSDDMQRFRRLTMGKPVIMGRKTYQSIGRPLTGRFNIVLTRDSDWRMDGVVVARTLDDALALAAVSGAGDEAMVIGGSEVYAQALPLASRIELTEVEAEPAGDAYFPAIEAREWRETARARHDGDPAYSFVTLERVN